MQVLKKSKKWAIDHFWPLLIITILSGVYISTLLPGVGGFGDTSKFQFLGSVLGTPHTSGYPLYIMLNYIFTSLFPFGSLAYKANLLSALFAIIAAIYLYRSLLTLKCKKSIAAITTLTFGLSATFWSQAILAEVYSLNAMLLSMVVFYLLEWHFNKTNNSLLIACAIYALSFGNHLTMILLLPAFIFMVFANDHKAALKPKNVLLIGLFILIGILQYGYVFWRYYDPSTAFLEMSTPDLKTFWWYISGAQFRSQFFSFDLQDLIFTKIPFAIKEIFQQYFFIGFIALWGFWKIRKNTLGLFLFLFFISYFLFVINYQIFDIHVYFIPLHLCIALYLGLGFNDINKHFFKEKNTLIVLMTIIPLSLLLLNYSHIDLSNDQTSQEIEELLETIGENSIILPSDYTTANQLWYYSIGEKLGENKNIYVSFHSTEKIVNEVLDYVSAETTFSLPLERKEAPRGLSIYTHGTSMTSALTNAGIDLERVNNEQLLYKVTGYNPLKNTSDLHLKKPPAFSF
jgi:hypothetical protein